jgi:hypothetical protein
MKEAEKILHPKKRIANAYYNEPKTAIGRHRTKMRNEAKR